MSAAHGEASDAAVTLDDRHLLVVGAGPGIGAAVARRFGREGYRVSLAARDNGRLTALARDLTGDLGGRTPDTVTLDASDPASLRLLLTEWTAGFGTPDVVVYNAATLQQDQLSALSPGEFQDALAAGVVSAAAAVQVVLPAMRQAGRGTVLFTGGGLALAPSPDYGSLSVAKSALRTAALVLGAELEPAGIHVATVTVAAFVAAGTSSDPARIAESFWELAMEPAGSWRHETVFDGSDG